MGVFDKFLDIMKLNDDEEDDIYDDDDDEEDEQDETPPARSTARSRGRTEEREENITSLHDRAPSMRKVARVTAAANAARKGGGAEVRIIKPTTYEDSKEVAETLLSNCIVVLNMEGLDLGLIQRIVDFTYGACYAIEGTFQDINQFIYVLAPPTVDVTGDLKNIVTSLGFSGIQSNY